MLLKKSSVYSEILYTKVIPVIGGFVVLLNILELIFIFKLNKRNQRKTVSLIYVASLSASDVLVGVVISILKSMDPFMKTTLKDDIVAKEFYGILKHVFVRLSLFLSIFNLMALTFDRFVAVRHPLKHRKFGPHFAVKVCILVWILSLACVVLMYCISRFHLSDVERYNTLVLPISAYPATIVFIVTYSLIYQTIEKSSCQKIQKKDNKNKQDLDDDSKQTHASNKDGCIPRTKKEMNFLKLAIKIIVVFAACWLPFSTCKLLVACGVSCGGKDIERTLFTLALCNSLINPFLYFASKRKQSRVVDIKTTLTPFTKTSRQTSKKENGALNV